MPSQSAAMQRIGIKRSIATKSGTQINRLKGSSGRDIEEIRKWFSLSGNLYFFI